jgi:hypothetical protein
MMAMTSMLPFGLLSRGLHRQPATGCDCTHGSDYVDSMFGVKRIRPQWKICRESIKGTINGTSSRRNKTIEAHSLPYVPMTVKKPPSRMADASKDW